VRDRQAVARDGDRILQLVEIHGGVCRYTASVRTMQQSLAFNYNNLLSQNGLLLID
jgi:hypothetical protein